MSWSDGMWNCEVEDAPRTQALLIQGNGKYSAVFFASRTMVRFDFILYSFSSFTCLVDISMGLWLFQVLLRHTPEEVARNFSIIENLMDLVSSTKQGTNARKLDMELKCSTDHLRLWRDVARVITRLVQCIMKTFFSGGKQTTKTCLVGIIPLGK